LTWSFESARRVIALGGIAIALVACGGTTPTPAPTAGPSAAPTAAVVASGAPSAESVVGKFQADPLTVHIDQTATAKTTALGTTSETTVASSIDLDGADLSITVTARAGDQELRQGLVVVGDTAYVREGEADWRSTQASVVESTVTNLLDSVRLVEDAAALRYVGPDTVDGQALHHFTSTRNITYVPAQGGTGQYDVFDLWVLDDGTPVLVKTTFSVTTGDGSTGTGTTDFRFSKYGGPIDISAPTTSQ
jgi:hypothetical protein